MSIDAVSTSSPATLQVASKPATDAKAQKLLLKQHHAHATSTAAAKPASVVNGTGQTTGEIINTKA